MRYDAEVQNCDDHRRVVDSVDGDTGASVETMFLWVLRPLQLDADKHDYLLSNHWHPVLVRDEKKLILFVVLLSNYM